MSAVDLQIVDVLVSSKRCAKKFKDLLKDEISDMFSCAQFVQVKLATFYSTDSCTLAVQVWAY